MNKRQKILLFSALVLVLAVYINGLKAPFYFDDLYVVDSLRIDNLSLKSLSQAAFHSMVKNRPLANLTLALNYYFTKDKVAGTFPFHVFNVGIHLACFIFIFLLLKAILALPAIPERYRDKAFPLALAAALVWAVHPIQTQSVTYIVQRMASMCALFYFMSLYFYIKARTGRRKLIFYASSGLAFLLALASKEIAITLPLAVLLVEWLLLRGDKKKILAVTLIFVLFFAGGAYIFMGEQLKGMAHILKQNKYENRDFLISERLLTQPRVFVQYISLVLFPYYDRFILDYDFKISRSLVAPITTLLAVLFVLGTIVAAFLVRRKNPLIAFLVFAFWLGHAVEGSLLNLEIIFEHRMYLPSAFLILALAAAASDAARKINLKKTVGFALLGILLLYLGINTILKNEYWNDPVRFFTHETHKSPGNYRSYHNLGVAYASSGKIETALPYFHKALSLNPKSAITYHSIGQCYYVSEDYKKAIPFYAKALQMGLRHPLTYINLSLCYIKTNELEEAAKAILEGHKKLPGNREIAARVGALYYFFAQELGRKGRDIMEKEGGINEARAFFLLETSYRLGNRDKDTYANLPPAYIENYRREPNPAKRVELMAKAKAVALEGVRQFPGDADLRGNLVGLYCLTGEWQEALKLRDLSKDDLNKLTVSLLGGERFKEALEVVKKAEVTYGSDQVLEFNKAICFFYLGDGENAVQTFKRIQAATSNELIKVQSQYFIEEWKKKSVQK